MTGPHHNVRQRSDSTRRDVNKCCERSSPHGRDIFCNLPPDEISFLPVWCELSCDVQSNPEAGSKLRRQFSDSVWDNFAGTSGICYLDLQPAPPGARM